MSNLAALPLATQARHRLLAWPAYDKRGDLEHLAREFASLLVGRKAQDACLCLRHDADIDPPIAGALASLQEALDRVLGKDADFEVLVVDDVLDEAGWAALGRAATAVLCLPSGAAGPRQTRLASLALPMIESQAALRATLDSLQAADGEAASQAAVVKAAALIAVGALDRALRGLGEQIKAGGQSPELLLTFAHVLAQKGAHDRAIDILRFATRLHPGYGLAHLHLAQLFQQIGNPGESATWAAQATALGEPMTALAATGPEARSPAAPTPPAPMAAARPRPGLSVVVVAHDLLPATCACVDSLFRTIPEPFELVLVDNGSAPAMGAWAERLIGQKPPGAVVYLRNARNEGFAHACNQGLAAATGSDFVAVVHNDVVVTPGWLARLCDVMASRADVGLVAPLLDSAEGPQQWAGATEGEPLERAVDKLWAAIGAASTRVRKVGSACMLIKRAVVDQIGGFDPIFGFGFGGDDDFCLRARRAGHQIAVAQGVLVHHARRATFGLLQIDPAASALLGWEKFCHKWNHPVEQASDPALEHLIDAAPFDPQSDHVPLQASLVLHRQAPPLDYGTDKAARFLCVVEARGQQWHAAVAGFFAHFTSADPVALVVRVEPPSPEHLEAVVATLSRLAEPHGDKGPEVVVEATPLPPLFRGSLYTAASAFLITGAEGESFFEREAIACGLPLVAAEAQQLDAVTAQLDLEHPAPARDALAQRSTLCRQFAALSEAGQFAAAAAVMQQVIDLGTDASDWQDHWTLAQTAARCGRLDLVDAGCAEVLKRNPEFWFARELPKHARGHYSQLGQDQIIEEFFRQQPPRHKVFVEVGAFDGKHYSNVRRLVEHDGWSGISVEPVGRNFEKLAASYLGQPVQCVRAAVGPAEGQAEIHVSSYPHLDDWGSDVASLHEIDRERWTREYGAKWHTEKVPLRRLDAILAEGQVTGVDLVSIDCEGADFDVLASLDLARFSPALLVVEYGRDRQRILQHAAAHGYSLLLDNNQDLFLARFAADAASGVTTRNYAGSQKQPYAEIQDTVERDLGPALGGSGTELRTIVIVGGYQGHEIPTMLAAYPAAEIHVFEANPKHFQILAGRFGNEPRVHCVNAAVAQYDGEATFFETTLEGAGSLLPIKTAADQQTWIPEGCRPGQSFTVKALKLDGYQPLAGKTIDLLWCDVQGAEVKVLEGARELLTRCRALFLEVWTTKTLYEGQCRFGDLDALVRSGGFALAGIGLCHSGNGTGNALWVRPALFLQPARPAVAAPLPCTAQLPAVTLAQAKQLLNPHLFRVLPMPGPFAHERLAPEALLTPQRLDLVAKLIYAKHHQLGVRSDFGLRLYRDHLAIISGFHEGDGSGKQGLPQYLAAFHALLADTARGAAGLDPRRSMVPVGHHDVIIDGAHRIAASLLHGRAVDCLRVDWNANSYGSEYFARRGLAPESLDALALEYSRIKSNVHVALLFPVAAGGDDEARAALAAHGRIVHEKQITLHNQGPALLVQQLYRREKWVGTPDNGFRGARWDSAQRFAGMQAGSRLRVFLVEASDRFAMRDAKERIRRQYGAGNFSVHITDTHAEAKEAAGLLFNRNSVHLLNHARWGTTPRFWQLLGLFRGWLDSRGLDPDQFAIDGSAIMSAYGIRDAQDLDFLHFGHEHLPPPHPLLSSHNGEMAHHAYRRDQIIFDPAHHFHFDGVKFGGLHVIRAMKAQRAEGKDRVDVGLIDAIDPRLGVSRPQPARSPNPPAQTLARPAPTPTPLAPVAQPPAAKKKLVAMVPARNEEQMIGFCLKALAPFVDAIVFLDDFSEDRTVEIVKSLQTECKVERILTKERWFRDEPGDRRRMLAAAREIGATHLISIDADEALTANGLDDNRMRELILALQPGDSLELLWICLWRGLGSYRLDKSVWSWNYKAIAFADDGQSTFASEFIHTPRVPPTLQGRRFRLEGYEMGLLHFQFVNWENLRIKQAWYRCLERVREPRKLVADINERYAPSTNEQDIGLDAAHTNWYSNYRFLDPSMFAAPDLWRKRQVRGWFAEYGREFFKDLAIWDIDWEEDSPVAAPAAALRPNASL